MLAQELEVHLEQDVSKVRDLADRPQPLAALQGRERALGSYGCCEQRAQRAQIERVGDGGEVRGGRRRFQRSEQRRGRREIELGIAIANAAYGFEAMLFDALRRVQR